MKHKILACCLVVALLALGFSCGKSGDTIVMPEDNKPHKVEFANGIVPDLTFSAAGGHDLIIFTAPEQWTTQADAAWLTLSPASGREGLSQIKVSAEPSREKFPRKTTFTLRCGAEQFSIEVAQAKDDSQPAVDHVTFANGITPAPRFDAAGGEELLIFEAPDRWSAEVEDAASCRWLTLSPAKGEGGLSQLKLTVNPSKERFPRKAVVWLTCRDEQIPIEILQAKDESQPDVKQLQFANGKVPAPEFAARGGAEQIIFEAPDQWTAEIADPALAQWLTLAPAGGERGLAQLKLSAATSHEEFPRNGSFTIHCGAEHVEISVMQSRADEAGSETRVVFANGIVPEPMFDAKGGLEQIIFEAPQPWSLAVDQPATSEWISLSPMSGAEGLSAIKLAVFSSQEKSPREGSFTLSCGEERIMIKVHQKENTEEGTDPENQHLEFANGILPAPIFTPEGGTEQIIFEAPDRWSVRVVLPDASWLGVSPKEGERGLAQLRLEAPRSDGHDSREADLELRCGAEQFVIHVVQRQEDVLEVSDTMFAVDKRGGECSVTLTRNVPYEVLITADWVHLVGTRTYGEEVLTFAVDPLQHVSSRQTAVTIRSEDHALSQEITITQTDGIDLPDPEFKSFVVAHFDTNHDGEISLDEAAAIRTLDCSASENEAGAITSVRGIELMPNLDTLICRGHRLAELNLGQNPELRAVDCSKNQIATLDLSRNRALSELNCADNLLTELALGDCPVLTGLDCSRNAIAQLDLTANPLLGVLLAQKTALVEVDLRSNPDLRVLDVMASPLEHLDLTQNLELRKLYCSHCKLSTFDPNPPLEDLDPNQEPEPLLPIETLDLSYNVKLNTLYIYGNKDLSLVYVWPGFSLILLNDLEVDTRITFVEKYN